MKKLIYLSVITISISSCDEVENKNTTKSDVKEEVVEVVETIESYSEEEKNELINFFETKKDQTRVQIDKIKKKVITVRENQKQALEETVQELEAEQQKLEEEVMKLKSSSDSAYNHIRIGIDSVIVELDQAIELANREFK